MPSNALAEFKSLLGFVDQLFAIHGRLQTGKGRRHQQEALHRAGVVLVVAAWESYLEKVLLEATTAVEASATAAGGTVVPAWARHVFAIRRSQIAKEVRRFHTPDSPNVRNLFKDALEFDPCPHWTWVAPRRNWNAEETRKRLDKWILIRHSVAHGFPLPTDVDWIKGENGLPRLTLNSVWDCKRFFEYVVKVTDTTFADFLHAHHGIPRPW